MQNVFQNEWKLYFNRKCTPKIMQNVVQIWSKMLSKNNAKCCEEWMKRENQCKMYSKVNSNCSPKIMQSVVQNEGKLYSIAKCSPEKMQNVVQIWCAKRSPKIMQNTLKNEWKR